MLLLFGCFAVFWSGAGWAAANGSVGGAVAYSIAPIAMVPCAGQAMLELEKKAEEKIR
jgi:hypothetical protein